MNGTKHPLDRWLWEHDLDKADFARSIGTSPSTITRICQGRAPKLAIALKIEEATAGAVTSFDLLDAAS